MRHGKVAKTNQWQSMVGDVLDVGDVAFPPLSLTFGFSNRPPSMVFANW